MCTALKFTENDFYKTSWIELINKEINKILSVSQDGSVVRSEKPHSPTDDSDAISKQTLYVKEKFIQYSISTRALNDSPTTTSLVCIKQNI